MTHGAPAPAHARFGAPHAAVAFVVVLVMSSWYSARFPSVLPWAGVTQLATRSYPQCAAAADAAARWDDRALVNEPSLHWWGGFANGSTRFDLLAPAWRTPCVRRYGPPGDGAKLLYDLAYLNRGDGEGDAEADGSEPCVVYSVGGNLQVEFEEAILGATPARCQVWQFDCTVEPADMDAVIARMPAHYRGRMHFLPYCVGRDGERVELPDYAKSRHANASRFVARSLASVMRELGHDRLDLLKFDAEGAEHAAIPAFLADAAAQGLGLPRQLSMVAHVYPGPVEGVRGLPLFRALYAAGYVEASRELNTAAPTCCMEFTFVHGCDGWAACAAASGSGSSGHKKGKTPAKGGGGATLRGRVVRLLEALGEATAGAAAAAAAGGGGL